MRKALLAVAVVFLMIVSMLVVASPLSGSIIPTKNGTSPMQPHGYYSSGLQTSSSSTQSVPQANLSTNSVANKIDSLLHNFNARAESPIQSNLLGSYKVTFKETGLPTGMPWQVTVENSSFSLPPIFRTLYNLSLGIVNSSSSTSTSITISLANGSYVYYTGPVSTDLGPYYFNVTGTMSITIPFPAFYRVTFTESGLPSGMSWNVISFNNSSSNAETPFYYNISSSSSMVSYLPNGTYAFLAGPRSTYLFQNPFSVIGRAISPSVTFPTFYPVTFTEVNLPSGEPWFLMANNTSRSTYYVLYFNFSNAVSKIAYLPDGGYNYQATEGIFSESSVVSGSFTVNNVPETVKVIFPVTYKITFTEKNLPAGADWSVIVSNYDDSVYYYNTSSGSSMIAYLLNGTYNYSGSWSSGGLSTPEHEFNVTGVPRSFTVIFPVTYAITFTEKNLPAGADWNVRALDNNYSVNYYNSSSASSMIAYLPNGTYNYSGYCYLGRLSTPYREFNVTGFPRTLYVVFPEAYSVVFTETGLPTGTTWYVSVYNSTTGYSFNSSSTSTITFNLYNGSYTYTVTTSLSGWKPSSSSGSFNVPGRPVNVPTITFSTTDHTVQFKESGLLTGTSWYVIFNATEETSNSNNITFYVPNGSYSYTLQTPVPGSPGTRYVVSPSYGTVTVSGSNVSENVSYSTQYYLTTYVSPTGTGTVSPSSSWFSAGSSVTLTAKAVSGYAFSSWSGSGTGSYTGTNNPLTLTMSGPVSETADFVQANGTHFTVTFTETGLPSGVSWYVNISGMASSGPINTTSYTVYLTNGTYDYMIATPDKIYEPSPISSTVNVVGKSQNVSITFTEVTYKVTFTETGLPSGTTWYVNLSNGMDSGAITGTSYSFSLANGTYSYTIATSDKTYEPSPSSGPFTVNGAPVSKSVSFSEVTYTVTFTESGLPSGTSWKMTFNGVMNSSTNSVMTFSAPNGTYSFSTSNLSSYYTLNYSGSISVKGNGVSIPIVYYHYAYISGTVTPHNATVDINGHSVSVTSSGSFNVSEASGTYYVVVSESGYTTSYNNVTLTAGQTKELNVTLNPVKTTPPPISSSFPSVDLYGIIGVVVAIVAVVAVVSLMRKKH